MANVLGSSTSNTGMQAPPPPPLPAGMSIVPQNGAGMQAPPPPPLPAGMSIVPQNGTGMQAPPPPPLPAGFHAIGETQPHSGVGMQAPPPPPLPAGMSIVTQNGAKMQAPRPSQISMPDRTVPTGRPTMSLADAMKNEELDKASEPEPVEIEEPEPKPVAKVHGGELFEGDYCFARSGMDGLYYRAHIDAVDDNGAMLTFFDETGEHIAFEKIYTQEEAYKAMQCFANWGNKGNYYPAKVIACAEDSYTVTYDEMPDMRDTLDQSMVRFAPW